MSSFRLNFNRFMQSEQTEGQSLFDFGSALSPQSTSSSDLGSFVARLQGNQPTPEPQPEPELPNIVDIATGSDDFNLLVRALSTAGLVETIQNAPDLTVFARRRSNSASDRYSALPRLATCQNGGAD